ELRGGATGNGIVIAEGVAPTAPSAVGALRFLLSGRSAFVDGQLVHVDSGAGEPPAGWKRPLDGKVAVVTGGARGIGAAIARTLSRDGARVVVVDVPAAGGALARVANEARGPPAGPGRPRGRRRRRAGRAGSARPGRKRGARDRAPAGHHGRRRD